MKITIVGAGNGGIVGALDLTQRGHRVTLFQPAGATNDTALLEREKGAKLNGVFTPIESFTRDASEALHGAEVVMLTIPSLVLEKVAKAIAPFLEPGQIVLINGASALNAYRFQWVMDSLQIETPISLCETMSLTYAARYIADTNDAELILTHQYNLFSAYPSRRTKELLERLKPLYDTLVPAANSLETTLNNGNPESHPAPAVLNAGRIDYAGDSFYLYKEGITEHTILAIEAIDEERKRICAELGFEVLGKSARSERSGYFDKGKSLLAQYNESPILKDLLGPTSLTNRYITEDVSNGLVLWASIGRAVGVKTPVMDAIILLTEVMLQEDFRRTGITLENLGLHEVDAQQLNTLF